MEATMRPSLLAIALAGLSLPAAAADQEAPPTGAAGGKIIFRQLCASCHGKDARGNGPVAKTLKTHPADLTRIAERHGSFPADLVAAHIDGRESVEAHGSREMPVWGDNLAQAVPNEGLREERIDRAIQMVVQYLEGIQTVQAKPDGQ
jgi:mono/diheme cytochrome c family protein